MGDLKWPPTEDDLRRLYLEEKLSAAKIANAYDLKYPNPKSGETLVLYHLKKFGIARRDRAEHIRKVTSKMVDEWVRRYQSGESLKQIAGTSVGPVTVWQHLKKRDVELRDKVEAQIAATMKHHRRPFAGDRLDAAYLIGLGYGDLNTVRHGRAIRARVSTTHPAMARLFDSLFSPYGHVQWYPREAKLTGFEWTLECDLEPAFEFMLAKPDLKEIGVLSNDEFNSFLAGFFDAEGSVSLHRKRGRYNPEVALTNTDVELLNHLAKRLRKMGLHPRINEVNQAVERRGVSGPSRVGRLILWRFHEVQQLLRVMPLRHSEKVEKSRLALALEYRGSRSNHKRVVEDWRILSARIKEDRGAFVDMARHEVETHLRREVQS